MQVNAPVEEKKIKLPMMRSLKAELVFGEAVRPPAGHDASYSNQKSAMGDRHAPHNLFPPQSSVLMPAGGCRARASPRWEATHLLRHD